jgi:hypothetical protein
VKPAAPQLLTIPQVAERLGKVTTRHVYHLIAAGELETCDIAGPGARKPKTRVTEDALAEFIERRKTKRTA